MPLDEQRLMLTCCCGVLPNPRFEKREPFLPEFDPSCLDEQRQATCEQPVDTLVSNAGFGVRGEGTLLESPLVSHVDLLPTLCDFAGIDAPSGLWGASLMPWIEGRRDGSPHDHVVTEWHTEWAYTVSPGRMVRTDRHKYTRYLEGDGEELYDLDADPGETLTLADDPAYSDILDTHRKALRAHLDETVDPFFDLAWKADPRWRNHEPGYRNHRGPAAPMAEG